MDDYSEQHQLYINGEEEDDDYIEAITNKPGNSASFTIRKDQTQEPVNNIVVISRHQSRKIYREEEKSIRWDDVHSQFSAKKQTAHTNFFNVLLI